MVRIALKDGRFQWKLQVICYYFLFIDRREVVAGVLSLGGRSIDNDLNV